MTTAENTGAAKYRAKRRRAWAVLGASFATLGIIVYLVSAYVGYAEGIGTPVQDYVSAPMAWALAALFLLLFLGLKFLTFKLADEVEIQDNNWASAIALIFHMGNFLAWELLYWLDAAPLVDARVVFGTTLVVFLLTLLLRRYWPR